MLPFLKRNHEASASGPVESIERKPDNPEEEYDLLEGVSEDLCDALEAKDYKRVAMCLRSAFQILESEPHEEGEHI